MRRRAYTSLINVEKPHEPKFLREQYESTYELKKYRNKDGVIHVTIKI